MRERLKHKYALSEQGVNDMIKAVIIVTIANLAFMVPVGLLYLLASDILNGGIPSSKLPMYIGGMVISILLIIITTYFQYNATFLATYVESGVRRRTLAEKLRKIPLSFFGKKDLADLTSTIMGDCAWLETASSHFFPQLFGSMCSTTIVTICLFFFNVKMTLAAVWVLPVAFFVVFGARPISHRLNENAMKYKLECQNGIQEGLETVRDLKSYNATNTYMEGLNKKIQAVEKHAVVSEAINAMFVCLSQLILKVGIGTTTLVGGILFAKGEIDALTFFMYLLVVSRMYDPFQVALENLSAIISTDTQCKRMDEILSHEEQDGNKTLSNQGYDINFDHVGFSYDGNEQILKDVSFTAKQGEVTALIGPSGSGKTTLCNLIARFWDVQDGAVRIGGKDVKNYTADSILEHISMVFQNVYLFHDSIENNIKFGKPDATHEEVEAAAKRACCHDFISALPDGYNTIIGEGGSTLSGGEKQRISIARAILKDAPIIILDEATSSVDPENEQALLSAISELTKNKTLISIAHRLSTVENADQIIVIDQGRIAQQGTHQSLISQEGIYRNFLNLKLASAGWQL